MNDAGGRDLQLEMRASGADKPLGSIDGGPKAEKTTDKATGRLKLHYLPPVRYWTGKEKPGELVDEVDIFLKATKPGGADRTKVVPFDKTGDKKTASIKIKIAPIVKLWLLKNPYVHKAQGGGAKDGKAALEYPDLEKHAEAIRGLFDAGGTMWVKPRLIIENVGGTKLKSTKLVHHAELFAGKDAEHKLELAKDAFTPEQGYKITVAHPEGKATGAATVTLEGELKISDIVAERLRAIVLTAKRLDEHLKFDLTTKAIEFVQACLDHIAETEVEELEKRLPEFFDFINAVKSYLAQLEIVAKAFVRTLKLHGLAYRRYMENGINFTMELLFHMLDKEQRELLWNGITQPRATIARGLRGLKVTPLVRVADDVAKAFKKEAQEAAEKVSKLQQSADELLDAAKKQADASRDATLKHATEEAALKESKEVAEKLAKELDEIEKVKKPIADEALEEAEKRMKDVEEGLTEGRSKLKGLEDREKPLGDALTKLETGEDGLSARKLKQSETEKHLSETADTLKTHTDNAKSLKQTGERLKGEVTELTEKTLKPAQQGILDATKQLDQTAKEVISKRSELVTETGKKTALDSEVTKLRDAALPSAEQAEQAAKRAHEEIAKRLKAESDELANAQPAKQALDDRVAQLNQAELPKAQKLAADLQRQLDELPNQIARDRTELVQQTAKKSALDSEVRSLVDQLPKARQAADTAGRNADAASEAWQAAERQVTAGVQSGQLAGDELRRATENMKRMRQTAIDQRTAADGASREAEQLAQRLQTAQSQSGQMDETVRRLQETVRQKVDSEAGLKRQHQAAQSGLENLRGELKDSTRKAANLDHRIGLLDRSVADLTRQVPLKKADHSKTVLEITRVKGLITQKTIQSRDLDAPIKTLQNQVKTLVEVTEPQKKAALSSARQSLEAAQGRLKKLNADLAQANAGAEEAEAGVKAFTDAQRLARDGVVVAERRVADAEAQIAQTKREIGKLAEEKQTVGKAIADLESKQPGAKSSLESAKKSADDLAEEVKQKQKSKDDASEKVRKVETDVLPKLLQEMEKAVENAEQAFAKVLKARDETGVGRQQKTLLDNLGRQADQVLEEARKTDSAQGVQELQTKINQFAAEWQANQVKELEAVVKQSLEDMDKALKDLESYLVIKDRPPVATAALEKLKERLQKQAEMAKKMFKEKGTQLGPTIGETLEDQLKSKLQEYQDTINRFIQEKDSRGKPKLPTYTDDWWGTFDWFTDQVKGVFSAIFGWLWEWTKWVAGGVHSAAEAVLPTKLYNGIASLTGLVVEVLAAIIKGIAYFVTYIGDTIIENASGEGPLSKAMHSWVTEPQREEGKSFLFKSASCPPTFFDIDQEKNAAAARLFHAEQVTRRFSPSSNRTTVESTLMQEVGGAYKDYYTAQEAGASTVLVALGSMALSPAWLKEKTLPGGWNQVHQDGFLDQVLAETAEFEEAFAASGDSSTFTAGLQKVWNKTKAWTAHDYDYMLDWLSWLIGWSLRFMGLIFGVASIALAATGVGVGLGLAAAAAAGGAMTASGVSDILFAFVRLILVGLFTMQSTIYLQHDMMISTATSYLTIFKKEPPKA